MKLGNSVKNIEKMNTPIVVAGSIVVAVVVLIVTGTAIKSLVGRFSRNNSILGRKNEVRKQINANIEAVNQLKSQYETLGVNRTLVLDALPPTPEFAGLTSMMENMANNAGMNMRSITAGQAAGTPLASGQPTEYVFTVSVAGSYETLKNFLENVETSLRPLAVSVISVGGAGSQLTVDIQMKTYYQPAFDTTLKTEPLFKDSGSSGTTTTTPTVPGSNAINPAAGVSP